MAEKVKINIRLPKKVLEDLEKAKNENKIASVSEAIRMGALLVAFLLDHSAGSWGGHHD